ncbi:MAG: hypothetical protein RLY31_2256 [Bacteroidota bacterium]
MEQDDKLSGTLQGTAVEEILTDFFYAENQLRYRLLLKLRGGDLLCYGEYHSFSHYMEDRNKLRGALVSGTKISLD